MNQTAVYVNTYYMIPTIDDVDYFDHSQLDWYFKELNLEKKPIVNRHYEDILVVYFNSESDAKNFIDLVNSKNTSNKIFS